MLYFTLDQVSHQLIRAKHHDLIEASVCGVILDTVETETGRAAVLPNLPAFLRWAARMGLETATWPQLQAGGDDLAGA